MKINKPSMWDPQRVKNRKEAGQRERKREERRRRKSEKLLQDVRSGQSQQGSRQSERATQVQIKDITLQWAMIMSKRKLVSNCCISHGAIYCIIAARQVKD